MASTTLLITCACKKSASMDYRYEAEESVHQKSTNIREELSLTNYGDVRGDDGVDGGVTMIIIISMLIIFQAADSAP